MNSRIRFSDIHSTTWILLFFGCQQVVAGTGAVDHWGDCLRGIDSVALRSDLPTVPAAPKEHWAVGPDGSRIPFSIAGIRQGKKGSYLVSVSRRSTDPTSILWIPDRGSDDTVEKIRGPGKSDTVIKIEDVVAISKYMMKFVADRIEQIVADQSTGNDRVKSEDQNFARARGKAIAVGMITYACENVIGWNDTAAEVRGTPELRPSSLALARANALADEYKALLKTQPPGTKDELAGEELKNLHR